MNNNNAMEKYKPEVTKMYWSVYLLMQGCCLSNFMLNGMYVIEASSVFNITLTQNSV